MSQPPASHDRSAGLRAVYVITPVLALCSLLFELLIAQTLATLAANTVVWYSLTIGTYVGFMGIGALWFQGFPARKSDWSLLYRVELGLCLAGASAVGVVHLAHSIHLYLMMHDANAASVAVFFGSALFVVSLVGLLTGIELPLLIRLGNRHARGRAVTNRVLGLDYIGSLAAGLVFPLVLLRNFDLFSIGFLTAAVNWSAAVWILWRATGEGRRPRIAAGTVAAGVLLALGWTHSENLQQYFLKRYYYYFENSDRLSTLLGSLAHRPPILRASSAYQKIDLVHDDENTILDDLQPAYSTKFALEPNHPRDHYLFLNGDFQVASNSEEIYHEYFAHIPVLLHGRVPERVLVLGAGDGILISELVKYPQIRSITHVDLDPVLLELARSNPILTGMNSHSLDDPRVHTQVGDAFQFVRTSPETFQAIYMDFPSPNDYNLAKLYSREFFYFVGQRLEPGGYISLDAVGIDDAVQEAGAPNKQWDAYYHSIRSAGFETVVPYLSMFEHENEAAFTILEKKFGFSREDPGAWSLIQRLVAYYVDSRQQGFIMAKREVWKPGVDYWELGIPLHVINEERFGLAFPVMQLAAPDPAKVNSIMRPTLPVIGIAHIRRAW